MIKETFSPEETFAFGKWIGEKALPGQVYTLVGDLGVGKTVFTQGVAEGLGITEPVNSPTFTIIQEYESGGRKFSVNLCKRGENRPDLESAGSGSSESDRRQTGCNHSRRVRNIYFTENKAKYAKIFIKKTLHAAICQMPFSNTLWHSQQCESETNDKVFLIRVR